VWNLYISKQFFHSKYGGNYQLRPALAPALPHHIPDLDRHRIGALALALLPDAHIVVVAFAFIIVTIRIYSITTATTVSGNGTGGRRVRRKSVVQIPPGSAHGNPRSPSDYSTANVVRQKHRGS